MEIVGPNVWREFQFAQSHDRDEGNRGKPSLAGCWRNMDTSERSARTNPTYR